MARVRRLRHWKQRFDKNAKFIFRRSCVYAGEKYEAGDPIPEALEKNKAKLRRFWESKFIELADFEAPNVATGQPMELPEGVELPEGMAELPSGVTVEAGNGSWFIVRHGEAEHKVNGKNALKDLLEDIALS